MSKAKEQILPPWGMAVAGSAGSIFANALVYPLDIVKTRIQVQIKHHKAPGDETHYESTLHAIQKIFEDEGLGGLYTGITGSLLGVGSANFAYFYWYSVVRAFYLSSQVAQNPPTTAIELSLGAIAGALGQLFTIPIAVVTTRQQTQKKGDRKGLFSTAQEVVDSEDGWTGLWRGLKASLVLVVNPAITYGAYQKLRQILYPGRMNLRPHEAFILGAMSKALATIVTQPLIVAKVRLQSKPPPDRNGKPFKSFGEVLAYTIRHEGTMSLYKGIGPQLAKGILVQGLMMMTKERVELLFMLLYRYLREIKREKLQRFADMAAAKAKEAAASSPIILKSPVVLK